MPDERGASVSAEGGRFSNAMPSGEWYGPDHKQDVEPLNSEEKEMRPKTFKEFTEKYLTGDEQVIEVPADYNQWPNIIVKHGDHVAVIQLQGLGGHLSIDVHPFEAGAGARAGVVGMEAGYQIDLPRDQVKGFSHGRPAAHMVTVLIGKQQDRAATDTPCGNVEPHGPHDWTYLHADDARHCGGVE